MAIQSYHTTEFSEKPSRDPAYVIWRDQVYHALFNARMTDEAALWENCSDPASFFVPDTDGKLPDGVVGVNTCSTDPKHQATAVCPTCQLRFCPDCCHRQSARLLARYMPLMRDLVADSSDDYRMRHIILTTPIDLRSPDCRTAVLSLAEKVSLCFEKCLGSNWREDCGLLFAFEFGENGLKLHFHCLVYCPYISQSRLVKAWKDVTNSLCEVAFIRLVTDDPNKGQSLESAVAEVLKYATKLWKRDKAGNVIYLDADLIPILAKVLKGTRRIRTYGLFYRLDVEEEPHVCETCASPIVRLSPLDWDIFCNTGFLPPEWKVVRRGDEYLSTYIGNNFFEDDVGNDSQPPLQQPFMPGFDGVDADKLRRMFGLGGKK